MIQDSLPTQVINTLKHSDCQEMTVCIYGWIHGMWKLLELLSETAWPIVVLIIFFSLRTSIIKSLFDKLNDPNTKWNISIGSVSLSVEPVNISLQPTPSDTLLNDLDAKNILSTFYHHQNEKYPDFQSQFTFFITSPNQYDNTKIQNAFEKLKSMGFITFIEKTKQYCLTNIGWEYCKSEKNKLNDFSYFNLN